MFKLHSLPEYCCLLILALYDHSIPIFCFQESNGPITKLKLSQAVFLNINNLKLMWDLICYSQYAPNIVSSEFILLIIIIINILH